MKNILYIYINIYIYICTYPAKEKISILGCPLFFIADLPAFFFNAASVPKEGSCFPNEFFPSSNAQTLTWELPTDQLTTTCADGYCPCPAVV